MKDVWHLHAFDWLAELAPEEKSTLRSASAIRSYAPAEMIFSPEPNPESVYLLEEGLARIFRLSRSGSETTFGYVAPGEVFGELAAFGDFPRESFAQAVRASRAWKMPREVFRRLIDARPGRVIAVTRQIGERFKRIESRVENLVFRDVGARVAGMLLELAEDFGRREGDETHIDATITQAEMASLVGSTRQTVNASLGDLETAGLIRRRGRHIVISKRDELARLAEETRQS